MQVALHCIILVLECCIFQDWQYEGFLASEYDQEMPCSHTSDQFTTLRGRDTESKRVLQYCKFGNFREGFVKVESPRIGVITLSFIDISKSRP